MSLSDTICRFICILQKCHIFVAKKLNKVPKYDPCEIDFISLSEKFTKLEGRINFLEKSVVANSVEISIVDKKVRTSNPEATNMSSVINVAPNIAEKSTVIPINVQCIFLVVVA